MKILVVEDDINIRRATVRLLGRMFDKADTWVAETADQAISHLRDAEVEAPFDLVICDWDLVGRETGKTVLEWVRAYVSRLERRFVFFSANDAAALQGVPYVEKPCELSTLRAAIEAVCEQRP